MSHAREQIRKAVAATVTGLPSTGSRVFPSRVWPVESELPSLSVYTRSEARVPEEDTLHPLAEIRELTVVIEIQVALGPAFDDTLDTVSSEVEAALYDALYGPTAGDLADLADTLAFATLEIVEPEPGDAMALGLLAFELRYRISGLDPETIL